MGSSPISSSRSASAATHRSRARDNGSDTQRELDAFNAIDALYEGKTTDRLRRLEIGNVAFTPPFSRFLSSVEDICALQGSRLVTCDNNFNRRQTQLVIVPVRFFGDAK